MTPRVVILSAPSGGGKTTITRRLLATRPDVGYSVSATTRPPRAGERDGQAYHFLSRAEFARRVAAGDFLEWAEYAGNRYGTLKAEVERVLAGGRHVVLDIEIAGARRVRAAYPPPASVSVFVLPPSAEEWTRRLAARDTEAGDALRRRLETAVRELEAAREYDRVIVNDDLDRAVRQVGEIIDHADAPPGRAAADDPAIAGLIANLRAAAERLAHAAH